jgi:hypothetical protein
LNVDPLFSDSAASDFHLAAGSPAIDAGIDVGVYTDLDGAARPQGAGYDIGPNEYVGDPSPYSCDNGWLCDNTSVVGSPGQTVCGSNLMMWTCTSSVAATRKLLHLRKVAVEVFGNR